MEVYLNNYTYDQLCYEGRQGCSLGLKPYLLALHTVFVVQLLQCFSDKILSKLRYKRLVHKRLCLVCLPIMLWLACYATDM